MGSLTQLPHYMRQCRIEVFRASTPTFTMHALTDDAVPAAQREAAAEDFDSEFRAILDRLDSEPSASVPGRHDGEPLNCLALCRIRELCLARAGFQDVFKAVKVRENGLALALLPSVLAELDSLSSDIKARWQLVLRGVFAGNIFDLGAAASAELYASGEGSFSKARQALLPRPWAIDHFDEIVERVPAVHSEALKKASGRQAKGEQQPVYRKVLMFVDNAGSDIVLGMLPLAREFLKLGSRVIMAANTAPSINDITAAELEELLEAAGKVDGLIGEAVASGLLRCIPSGNDLPVIDLAAVSEELSAECRGVDLVILEGMGRAIETNLHSSFTCDSWKLGMIKHREVATCLQGRLYDCVCKFDKGRI